MIMIWLYLNNSNVLKTHRKEGGKVNKAESVDMQQVYYNSKGGDNDWKEEITEKEKLDLKGKQTNYFHVHEKENYSR